MRDEVLQQGLPKPEATIKGRNETIDLNAMSDDTDEIKMLIRPSIPEPSDNKLEKLAMF